MYVLGKTNLDRYPIHYDESGAILPEVFGNSLGTPEGSAGCIWWTTRPLRGADRQLFEAKADDDVGERDGDRAALIAMTVSIEGLAVLDEGGQETEITALDESTYGMIDAEILTRAMRRITSRMNAVYESLGESERPSDS